MEQLFDTESFTISQEPTSEPEGLRQVRACQAGWWAVLDKIPHNLTLDREPLYGVEDQELVEQVALRKSTSEQCSSFCRTYCMGKCVFAAADEAQPEQLRLDLAEVLAGDTRNTHPGMLGGRQVYTTPVLQITNRVLSRTATPGGSPVENMAPATVVKLINHLASTRLGRVAGLAEQVELNLAS